ncbi:MAG: hypothetical protein ABSE73_23765 [Planctomycetota bacterium]
MKQWSFALMAVWVACQAAASDGGARPQEAASGWERYQVLVRGNIFFKDRAHRRAEARPPAQKDEEMGPPDPKVESENVLIGVLEKDGELVAFLENSRSGTVQMLRTGDAIARGKIGPITLERIAYVVDEAKVLVDIGKNLEGGVAGALGEVKGGATISSPSDSSASPEERATMEKMRKKRQEEMNK